MIYRVLKKSLLEKKCFEKNNKFANKKLIISKI
jgi:hypothetical protein